METPPLPLGRPEIRFRHTSAPFSHDDGLVGSTNDQNHASASTSNVDNGHGHLLDRPAPPPPLPPRPGPAASSSSIRSVSESSIASGLRASTIAAAPSFQHVPQVVYDSPALPGEARPRLSTSDIGSRPPSPTPSDLSGFLSRSHSYDTAPAGIEQRQQDFEAALEKLKEIELSEFIERTSKHMDEVHFYDTTKSAAGVPHLDRYRDGTTGQTQYLAFAEAWLFAMADTYLPRDMVSGEKPSKLSISKSLAAMERVYILLPPQLVQHLLEGKIAALYRWRDPFKTGRYALVRLYLALWWYDQLPAAVFVFFAYQILKPKIWPPDSEQVRKDLLSRIERSKEAKEIGKDMEQQAKMSHLSHSIASSIGVATMMGGVALNMAPDRVSPPLSEAEDDSYHGKKAKTRLGKRGTYRLVMELLDRFGPTVQLMLTDTADLFEKVKNLLLWRRPSATKQSLMIVGACALVLSVLGSYLQLKLLLLWVWFQFFFVWPLQDLHPRHRRALNPLWYLLWNIPTDAESALDIIKARAAEPKTQDDPRGSFQRSRTGDSDTLSVQSKGHGRSKSFLSLVDSLSGNDDHSTHSSTKHFALYKGLPGNLIFTATHIKFETIKGFRRLSSKILRKFTGDSGEAVSGETAVLFSMPFSSIIAVKKESRLDIGLLDTDGLYITFSNSTTMRLASVSRRDEAFAFILSRSAGKTG